MLISTKRIDELANDYENQKIVVASEQYTLESIRAQILDAIERHGHTPPRAIKTKALSGDQFEIRVSYPAEVTVDTGVALRIFAACHYSGAPRLFARLFKRVETFVLRQGAHELLNANRLPKYAPRNLRSLFARAISVRELAPQLEVRSRQKAEGSGRKAGEAA